MPLSSRVGLTRSMRELMEMPFDELVGSVEEDSLASHMPPLPPLPSLPTAASLSQLIETLAEELSRSNSAWDGDGWPLGGLLLPHTRPNVRDFASAPTYHPPPPGPHDAVEWDAAAGSWGAGRPYTPGAASDVSQSAMSYGSGGAAHGVPYGSTGGSVHGLPYEQLVLLDEANVTRGVRPEIIRALPTRTARRADASRPCHVCLERPAPGATRLTTLPCGHAFCTPCIAPWLGRHATCPVCRWAFPARHTQRVDADARERG